MSVTILYTERAHVRIRSYRVLGRDLTAERQPTGPDTFAAVLRRRHRLRER